jgi:hypothetical protein
VTYLALVEKNITEINRAVVLMPLAVAAALFKGTI